MIDVTYKVGVRQPHTDQPFDFINQYMDDTVWWGLAWLNASQYELYYRHNIRDATRFLRVAEKDAVYVARKRQCGGIVWSLGSPAGTITNAEYVALTAELSQYRRTSSTFHDPGQAARWLSDSRQSLGLAPAGRAGQPPHGHDQGQPRLTSVPDAHRGPAGLYRGRGGRRAGPVGHHAQ